MKHSLVLFLLAAVLPVACSAPPANSVKESAAANFDLTRLRGVWEAIDYREMAGPGGVRDRNRQNDKYCFTATEAYLALGPEQSNDSADGWSQYHVVRDLLVFDGPAGAASVMRVQALSGDRLVLVENGLMITLRRLSHDVDPAHFRTPVLRPRTIPVRPVGG